MSVPDFQSMMLPLLQFAQDGTEHAMSEARDAIARAFGLTDVDRRELLPSGVQRSLDNRVSWATHYLRHANLLVRTSRGKFAITGRGREVLDSPPPRIDIAYLRRYPEFVEFHTPRHEPDLSPGVDPNGGSAPDTPEAILDRTHLAWKRAFADELLERVKACSPAFFEQLVVDLLSAMGYGGSRRDAAQAVGASGDGGVDGVIKEDRLGLDVIYVQAKRWDGAVGRPVVQGFAGSLEGFRARKGIIITTSSFSQQAYEYVERIDKRIVLIDGAKLAGFMVDNGIGVTEVARYVVQRIDSDYFGEE
jgi:restriction system protein